MNQENSEDLALRKEAESINTSGDRLYELAQLNDNLAEIAAKNSSASRKMLYKLASHKNKAVMKAVATNPNTPAEKLLELCLYFPREALDNPAFKQLEVDDLKYPRHISINAFSVLVQQSKVPYFILDYAAKDTTGRTSDIAKMNVSISGEMAEGWHEAVEKMMSKDFFVRDFIIHFNGVRWFSYGARLYGDPDKPSRSFQLLTNFYELIPDKCPILKSPIFKTNLAKNLNTAQSLLKQLAGDESSGIRIAVAENLNTATEILESLAYDKDNRVRNSVAGNPNTSIKTLKSLARDRDSGIRYRVAGNSSTPSEILALLADDESGGIRIAVAENSSTSADTLRLLANDSNSQVRAYVARNFNTQVDTLKLLANESNYHIRSGIAENPSAPIEMRKLFCDPNTDDYRVARNPDTSIEKLKLLATNRNNRVRECVSDNPNLSVETLKLLSTDPEERIRFRVARHPNTSLEILELLAKDDDEQVRASVQIQEYRH